MGYIQSTNTCMCTSSVHVCVKCMHMHLHCICVHFSGSDNDCHNSITKSTTAKAILQKAQETVMEQEWLTNKKHALKSCLKKIANRNEQPYCISDLQKKQTCLGQGATDMPGSGRSLWTGCIGSFVKSVKSFIACAHLCSFCM